MLLLYAEIWQDGGSPPSCRRQFMRRWLVVPLVAVLVTAVAATPASATPSPPTPDLNAGSNTGLDPVLNPVVMTPATGVAARTDRRPVAGGLYDARANTTFISWGGQFEDNYVQAYDHRAGTW